MCTTPYMVKEIQFPLKCNTAFSLTWGKGSIRASLLSSCIIFAPFHGCRLRHRHVCVCETHTSVSRPKTPTTTKKRLRHCQQELLRRFITDTDKNIHTENLVHVHICFVVTVVEIVNGEDKVKCFMSTLHKNYSNLCVLQIQFSKKRIIWHFQGKMSCFN